jgi:protoporphyrinogen oxidase
MKRFSVIGGGMLGMRTAQLLARAGADVTLHEAADHLGGLADAWKLGDVTWDRHYHVTLLSDLELRSVMEDLGLEDATKWVETKTGFFTDGELYSMSNTVEFLKFPPLGMIDKLRLGGTIFLGSKIRNWQKLETILVEDWLRKWSGSRTTNKMWLPLLRAKLGENYRQTSAAFIWATIARMYAARRSGLKKEMFGYISGGYQRLLDAYEQRLVADGVKIRTSCVLQNVEKNDAGVELRFADGSTDTCDNVVMTVPSPLISKMCPQLTSDEHDKLNGIQYQGIVCASLVLKESLSPYYVTNITDDWVPFTAVIEMSALVDKSEFGGKALIYLPRYADPTDPVFEKSDEDLQEEFVSALEKMYPHFNRDQVEAFKVSRVRHVVGLSTLNYSKNLPEMQTSVPGVYAVNSTQIVNGTLNVNETLCLAKRAFEELLQPRLNESGATNTQAEPVLA